MTPDPAFYGSGRPENILFTTETDGGRGFAIFLGHDIVAMKNTAWRTLLQRGTEWAASGKVTIPPAENWPATREAAEDPALSWVRTDTSLALCNGDKTIWRLVFDAKQPKSYFHPLATVGGEVLTAFEPADHPWHRGLWWSWKFINGLNYWEENRTTQASEGVSELTRAAVVPGDDFTARAELAFSYHPPGQPSGPEHWLFQGPPAESKLLAAARRSGARGARHILAAKSQRSQKSRHGSCRAESSSKVHP